MDDPLDVLRCAETLLQPLGDLSQCTRMPGAKWSFKRFRDILRLVQPKPLGRHLTFYQLFAISLDVLDENGLSSIWPGKAREHNSRALGTQETLHHDCHRRYLVNANLTEVSESTRREHRCPNLPNGRFKLFRRADRDRFKNTRERMGAAVFNGG